MTRKIDINEGPPDDMITDEQAASADFFRVSSQLMDEVPTS